MAEPDRTNADAERVSDIVARLRPAFVVDLPVSHAISALRDEGRFKSAEALNAWLVENDALKSEAADIIEAQSKALAEARELVAAGNNLLDCANAIVGASMGDPDADEAFDMFDAARGKWRLHARDTLSALVTPTPENPNG